LQPHLGVVQYKDGRSFVLTDLPGLIEGAHAGAGLGHRFLKHMQRCRAIVHLVDASTAERDLVSGFDAINRELELFDPALRRKPQVVAANKIDVPEGRERAKELAKKLKRRKIDVHLVSAATGEGLGELVDAMMWSLDRAGAPQPLERDVRASSAQDDGERMSEERVSVRRGGKGARAKLTAWAKAAGGPSGSRGAREPEDEREVDRVEKERRSPPEGRRARERKAARVKRR
jgi:GTP-binding protein